MKRLLLVIAVLLLITQMAFAKSVTAVGEAQIQNDDKASARIQAIARAKWAALEDAAGIEVKTDAIVQNAQLIDEAVKTNTKGIIKSFKVLKEETDGETYRVKISAYVEKTKAKNALSQFSKNTTIAVMLPVVYPDRHVEISNPLSERVIDGLITEKMDVIDLSAQKNSVNVAMLDRAIKTRNYMAMTNIAFNHMSNTLLIGKVITRAHVKKGQSYGYGNALPFNVVQGELSYRLLSMKDGRAVILKAGTLSARGMGATMEDATYRMTQDLGDRVADQLVGVVLQEFMGQNSRLVTVRISRNTDLDKLMELKQQLTYTSWVLSVKEKGNDTLLVQYPEKSLYLATAINSKPNFKVKKLSDFLIVVEPQF